MISNDIKTRIVLAISENRQNYATDAKPQQFPNNTTFQITFRHILLTSKVK